MSRTTNNVHVNTDSSTLYLVTDLDKTAMQGDIFVLQSTSRLRHNQPRFINQPTVCLRATFHALHSQFYHNVLHSPVDNCILQRFRVILNLADSLVYAQKNRGLQPLQHTNVCLNVLRSKCLYVKIFTAYLENRVSKLLPNHIRLLKMMRKEYYINFLKIRN